jgi:thymidylate synthase ThyX
MNEQKKQEIDNLRSTMGTLPSQSPKKSYEIIRGVSQLETEMYEQPCNPYKTICESVVATWGDDKYETVWPKLTHFNRFKVVLSVLQGQTLPAPLESIDFSFIVRNVPRHCFGQHRTARVGQTFYSIGSRDNNKLDSKIILYTKLYDKCFLDNKETEFGTRLVSHIKQMKDLYEELLQDKESWQIARAILPMAYHHSYKFSINYLALKGFCSQRMKFCEEEFICALAWKLSETIKTKFPLLANYLRPGCDSGKVCQYSKSYSLSNAFGCLFSSCGRNKSGTEYSTFNESCSDIKEIEKQLKIKIPEPNEWSEFTENDYEKLDKKDKDLFESN